ncbi:MAG: serine--tRNA ligase [Rhizobiales bacterium 24-66-13]|jgi:seryl-tRNA synthetase|nr:MAG: serine--tRNA ligase [Rhizobiales bacterium 24-66-13]OZB03717.1 MAG: serine--tRNA ligase [Rhizobiales bacterium 39-66-18]HQS09986.1 serine--tRNA ligase [Xanthobacteraceae bacterium]
MHDIKWVREQPEGLVTALTRRRVDGTEATALRDKLLALDEQRRATLTTLEGLLARRNAASKEVGQAKAAKDEARAAALMEEVGRLKVDIPALEQEAKALDVALTTELAAIPNVPLDSVPDGADEHDNVEKSVCGTKPAYDFAAKQHFEVGEGLGMMDFDTAAKLSGARFVVNKGPLARMERALGQFFLDVHTQEHGYTEVNPPLLVGDDAMFGTAQLPKFEEDQFFAASKVNWKNSDSVFDSPGSEWLMQSLRPSELRELASRISNISSEQEDAFLAGEAGSLVIRTFLDATNAAEVGRRRWLIPTAEVPLTNLVRESILSEEELPLRLTACTPCFRAEAGSAGRDTRGMIRQHQFTKVELVSITTPEKSLEEHERMLACAEAVLKKLDLHYRVVTLCTGDMGFASQKTYDIEVWLPGQGMYREISSCSVCGDFQARRMNARYRPADSKSPRFVHTLNGSGVAVGRALVAVLENYQQENGAVAVPAALAPYMGGLKLIEKLK